MEEFIPGDFEKHVNSSRGFCGDAEIDLSQKAECLVHYTYERSDKNLMLLDIQGCGYLLCDPEIASKRTVLMVNIYFVLVIYPRIQLTLLQVPTCATGFANFWA